jgi:hypothetical protein
MLRRFANSLLSRGPSSPAGTWYLFGVSGLTIFLLAIVLFGGLASQHEFHTAMQLRTRAAHWRMSDTLSPGQITRELTDNSTLSEALAKAGYFSVAEAQKVSRAQALSDVLQRLHVDVRHDTNGDLQVQIQYRASDPALAAAVVNHLANEYAVRYRNRIDRELLARYTQAREQAEQARRVVSQCEAEVERFLEQVFPRTVVQQHRVDARQSSTEPHPYTVVLASAEVAVTDVGQLRDHLLELQRQRFELLKTRTLEHPAVQAVQKAIADTEERLEQAEELLTTPVEYTEPTTAVSAEVSALSSELQKMLANHQKAAQTFHTHRTRLERLLAELAAAEEAERAAWSTHQQVLATPLVEWSPAAGNRMLDPVRWRSMAGMALFTALSTAAALAWLSQVAWRTYISPAQLQSELGVPLAATLRTHHRYSWSPRALARQALGGWRIFCEVALLAGIVWVLSLCFAEQGYASDFVQDPLAQLAGTTQRLAGLLGR